MSKHHHQLLNLVNEAISASNTNHISRDGIVQHYIINPDGDDDHILLQNFHRRFDTGSLLLAKSQCEHLLEKPQDESSDLSKVKANLENAVSMISYVSKFLGDNSSRDPRVPIAKIVTAHEKAAQIFEQMKNHEFSILSEEEKRDQVRNVFLKNSQSDHFKDAHGFEILKLLHRLMLPITSLRLAEIETKLSEHGAEFSFATQKKEMVPTMSRPEVLVSSGLFEFNFNVNLAPRDVWDMRELRLTELTKSLIKNGLLDLIR